MSTRRASSYAQVSAAIRAMKSKMLGRDGYDRLLTSSSGAECMSILREQDYFEGALEIGESLEPSSWENLFETKMLAIAQKLIRLSPNDCRQLLAEFQKQYRLELVKSGLRVMIAHEEGIAPSGTQALGLTTDFLRSVVESRNIGLLVQATGAPDLESEISSALAENVPIPFIEAIVDRYALTRLWKATDMHDPIDKQSARPLVGEHIDATNLLLAVRSKALGIRSEEAQRILVPVNYRLGDALSEAIGSGSTTNALRAFTKTSYGGLVSTFLETFKEGNALHPLDMSLRKAHAKNCLSTFSGFPFCAGLPLAFAYLTSYEISDLRSIISGKQDTLGPEKIEDFLILQKAL